MGDDDEMFDDENQQDEQPADENNTSEEDDETMLQSVKLGAPASLDWRQKGAVTPVANQGSCGGCYTFSTAHAVEGAYFLKTGKLIPMSKQ